MSKVNHRRPNVPPTRPPRRRKRGAFDYGDCNRQECRERAGYKQHVRHQQRAADRREMVAVKQDEQVCRWCGEPGHDTPTYCTGGHTITIDLVEASTSRSVAGHK